MALMVANTENDGNPGTVTEEKLPRGAYSKIARRMRPQVTPTAVRLVALGKSTSARISAAIERFKREHAA